MPHAEQGILRSTATEASSLEPTLGIKRSLHSEKPKHRSCREPAQPEKRTSKKKVTLDLDEFKMTCGTSTVKEEIKLSGAGAGGSLLVNHPHDGGTSASWMKGRCLISSPATNSNLASVHGHTQSARRRKLPTKRARSRKVVFQK